MHDRQILNTAHLQVEHVGEDSMPTYAITFRGEQIQMPEKDAVEMSMAILKYYLDKTV